MAEHTKAKAAEDAERLYLAVPFEERREARGRGARWDPIARRWYAPARLAPSLFARWASPIIDDPMTEFVTALNEAGLILHGAPQMDGNLRRVRVHGDKPGARSGAYIGHLDHRPAGFIQNFKTGEKRNWKTAETTTLTAEERARLSRHITAERERRDQAREAVHAETCRRLREFLAGLPLAGRDHPYLQRKGVDAHGLFLNTKGSLAIPGGASSPQYWSAKGDLILSVNDIDGRLISAQCIDAQGRKTFPRGGRIGGGHLLIGDSHKAGFLVITEGYATAATVHELTGLVVAISFNAGNLEQVARSYRDLDPHLPIVIASDNDHQKPSERMPNSTPKPNTGREAAEKAASAVGGIVLLPRFAADNPSTDWNDLATKGSQAFFDQWEAQMATAQGHLKRLFSIQRQSAGRSRERI